MDSLPATDDRTSRFYDRIAADYERMVETDANHAARECFWTQAEALLPERASILDFGAGSGLDAEQFAELGHNVTAYEPSAGMIEQLRRRCAALLAAGRVCALSGTLDEARSTLVDLAPFDGILCNFAVVSSIPRLEPAFELFAQLTRPGSIVLMSIQNPWYPPDLRTGAFWKGLLGLPFRGVIACPSAELGFVYHHTSGQVRKAARPAFVPYDGPTADCCASRFGWRSPFNLVALRRA